MSNTYSAGIATAYGAAVRGGYTGTYDEWCALMADYATVGEQAAQSAQAAQASAENAAESETAASTSESNAANSATSAGQSATAAAASETAAQAAETNAATSATNAAGSASAAATSATNAAASEAAARAVEESIPEDYSELSADVSDLKSDLLHGRITFNGYTWETGKIDGTTGGDAYNAKTSRTVGYYATDDVDVVSFSDTECNIGIYYYNNNKEYVKNIVVVGTSQTSVLVDHSYPYYRLGFNKADYSVLPNTDDIVAYKYTSTQDSVNSLQVFIPKTEAGYIGADGSIVAPSSDRAELHTEKIPVKDGMVVNAALVYQSSSHNMWFALATYDIDGNFIERINIVNSQAATQSSHTLTVSGNVGFIAYTFRSYNDYNFTVQTSDIIYVLFQLNRENKKEWEKYSVNENVRSVNHRGYNLIAPENTLPAYKLSKLNGFKYVETDVQFTSDGVAVCLHDSSINRTARNSDGTTIPETLNIASITYEQALAYDFGVYKNTSFAGTKIPTFEEFMLLCKRIGLLPYVELKAGTQEQITALVSAAFDYGMLDKTVWISSNPTLLEYLKAADSTATLGIITSAITSDTIRYGLALKTDDNIVFIDSSSYTDAEIAMCKAERFPLEVWTLNDISVITTNLDDYITGVTSDYVVAGAEIYRTYIGD